MKIHIWSDGDETVGSFGYRATVEMEYEFQDDPEDDMVNPEADREYVRRCLANAFSAIWDDKAHVAFEDELKVEPEVNTDWSR
jgi:hypothetical protein